MPVIVVRSGVGMVASAAATEHSIATHDPRCIINFGSAGAQVRDILPGDIVIGGRVVAYSVVQVLRAGEEPHVDRWYSASDGDSTMPRFAVRSAPELVDRAWQVAQGWAPEPWSFRSTMTYQPDRPPVVRSSVVISADMWVQSPNRIDQLHMRHDSLAADMEAAAIGQVAAIYDIPFLTIKDISSHEFYLSTLIQEVQVSLPANEHGERAAVPVSRLLRSLAPA
jgi:adenosylhomocysteine nucleosidase